MSAEFLEFQNNSKSEFRKNSKSEFRKNVNQNSNKMLEEFLEGTVLAGKNTVSEKMSLIAIWDELYQKS